MMSKKLIEAMLNDADARNAENLENQAVTDSASTMGDWSGAVQAQ